MFCSIQMSPSEAASVQLPNPGSTKMTSATMQAAEMADAYTTHLCDQDLMNVLHGRCLHAGVQEIAVDAINQSASINPSTIPPCPAVPNKTEPAAAGSFGCSSTDSNSY